MLSSYQWFSIYWASIATASLPSLKKKLKIISTHYHQRIRGTRRYNRRRIRFITCELRSNSLSHSERGQDERVVTIIKNTRTCGTSRKLVAVGVPGQPRINVRGRFAWRSQVPVSCMIGVTRAQCEVRCWSSRPSMAGAGVGSGPGTG